jgi:hypothetical protein
MGTYQLNVIFHGPFIFVKYDDHIEALTPYIDGHDIGAGTWQMEQPCDADTYTLSGISPQECEWQPPDPSTHVILDPNNFKNLVIPTHADYKFKLPLPCSMTALGLIKPDGALSSASSDITIPPQWGSAHVFSYIMDENDKPKLVPGNSTSKFEWIAGWKQVTFDSRAINLHIFSESALDMGVSHVVDVCNTFSGMVGLALTLNDPLPHVKFALNLNVRSQGVDDEEQGGIRGLPSPVPLFSIDGEVGLLIPPEFATRPAWS